MKDILPRDLCCRKYFWLLVCVICCAASFGLMADFGDGGVANAYGKGLGIPLYKGAVDPLWLESKGDMGYPVGAWIYLSSLLSLFVLCAAGIKDAGRLAMSNLAGIVCIGLLSRSVDYIEACTHDTVMAAAWIAGCMAVEKSKAARAVLGSGFVLMVLCVGELWHGFGGSWCPLRDSERLYGEWAVVCAGLACAVSVYSKMMQARLGLAESGKKVRAAALALALFICAAAFMGVGLESFGKFHRAELGLIFGLGLPLSAACLNLALALYGMLQARRANGRCQK